MTERQFIKLLTSEHGAQTRWARRLGVGDRAVRRWVAGDRPVGASTLRTVELWLRAEALVGHLQDLEPGTAPQDAPAADLALGRLARFLEADGEPRDASEAAA